MRFGASPRRGAISIAQTTPFIPVRFGGAIYNHYTTKRDCVVATAPRNDTPRWLSLSKPAHSARNDGDVSLRVKAKQSRFHRKIASALGLAMTTYSYRRARAGLINAARQLWATTVTTATSSAARLASNSGSTSMSTR